MERTSKAFQRAVLQELGLDEAAKKVDWLAAYTAYRIEKGEPTSNDYAKICRSINEYRPSQQNLREQFETAVAKEAVKHPGFFQSLAESTLKGMPSTAAATNGNGNGNGRGKLSKFTRVATNRLASLGTGIHTYFGNRGLPKTIRKKGEFINEYGHTFGSIPPEKQQLLKNENGAKVLRQRKGHVPDLSEEEIRAITPNDDRYGMYPGQFHLPQKFYYRYLAETTPLSQGGKRKTRRNKEKRHRKTRRYIKS